MPGGCLGFLNHQHYVLDGRPWTLSSKTTPTWILKKSCTHSYQYLKENNINKSEIRLKSGIPKNCPSYIQSSSSTLYNWGKGSFSFPTVFFFQNNAAR